MSRVQHNCFHSMQTSHFRWPSACPAQAKGATGGRIQELAVAYLGDYAESSVINCGKIAAIGGGRALAEVAAAAALDGDDGGKDRLKFGLTRVMGILAHDCPIR